MDAWDMLEPANILKSVPENFSTDLTSKKWLERKSALESLHGLLIANPRLSTTPSYVELVQELTKVLTDDSNINVLAMAAKCMACLARGLREAFAPHVLTVVPAVLPKFKEKKPQLREPLADCMDAIGDYNSIDKMTNDIVEAMQKPNPDIKIQVDSFIYRHLKRLNASTASKAFVKTVTPILVKHTGEPDAEVRNASCMALGAIQKCIGEKAAGVLFGDLKNDKIKMTKIDEACEKAIADEADAEKLRASSVREINTNGSVSTPAATNAASAGAPAAAIAESEFDAWDMLEPANILKSVPENFSTDLTSKKWLERKSALESLHGLLIANPRLSTTPSYVELVQELTKVLTDDSNINVLAMAAKCMACLARGLREAFAPHVLTVVPAVLPKFKEKKPQLREPLADCMDAIGDYNSIDKITNDIVEAMQKPNPDIKIQVDSFIYRHLKRLNASTASKAFVKTVTPILVKHTGEPDAEVRNASCMALGAIQKCIGEKAAGVLFGDLKNDKIKMTKVDETYKALLAEAPHEVAPPPPPAHQQTQPSVKPKAKKAAESKMNENAEDADKEMEPDRSSNQKTTSSARDEEKTTETATKSEETSLLRLNSDRAGRAKDEKSHKLIKWNFEMPTVDHIQQLSNQLMEVAKPELSGQLLSRDFKQHIKAIDYLQQLLSTEPAAIVANIDLLLRWATLRFFDTNPSVLLRLMDFICSTFAHISALDERITELEMTSFLPYLILKCGDQKEVIRNNVRRIVKLMGEISVPGKIFPILLDGLKTKNSRQKADCLIIIDSFLECVGVNITSTPQQTMKILAACISDRDSSVRNAALNAIVTVYKKIGDRVFPLIGQLNEKERAMLDERIKRSGKMVGCAPDVEPTARSSSRDHSMMAGGGSTSTPRARSASAARRSLNISAINSAEASRFEDDDTVLTASNMANASFVKPANRSVSRSRLSMGVSRFQLDPKFFNNDIDLGDAANATFTVPPADTSVLHGTTTSANVTIGSRANVDVPADIDVDLKGIQPVVRPSTRTHFAKRSESISSISSLESIDQIERTVYNLSCLQLRIANEAIAQLRHLLQDTPNRSYVEDRGELILKTLIAQFFQIRSQHFEALEDGAEVAEVTEFMCSICNFLLLIFANEVIVRQFTADMTRSFIEALLSLITDKRLELLSDYKNICRSLNVVTLRLCSSCNQTYIFVGLIKLLTKYQSSNPDGVLIDLVRKCLYKHADVLLNAKNFERLDLPAILDALYQYYEAFHTKQSAPTTESLKNNHRVLNICIQRIVLNERYKILNYLCTYAENNVLVSLIRRNLRSLNKISASGGGGGTSTEATLTLSDTTVMETTALATARVIPDDMAQMFRRINDGELFDGSVEELYNFLDVHGEQNGNFKEMLNTCAYSFLIQRAFVEIRQSRARREQLAPGESVLRVLPEADRRFVEEQNALRATIRQATAGYEQQKRAAAGGSQ